MSTRMVEVRAKVLKQNDLLARALRERFRKEGTCVVSLVSSPGSGKTAFLEKLLAEYAALVEAGQDRASGWPSSINVVSKIGQVAAVRIMARDYQDEARRRGLLINAACPGLVETEASRPWFDDMSSAQSPDAAAVDVAWLATRPAGVTEPYGELVQHRVVLGYDAR